MTAKKLLRSLEQSLQRACDHKQETRQLLILHYWNRFHHVGSQSIEAHSWPIFFFLQDDLESFKTRVNNYLPDADTKRLVRGKLSELAGRLEYLPGQDRQ